MLEELQMLTKHELSHEVEVQRESGGRIDVVRFGAPSYGGRVVISLERKASR